MFFALDESDNRIHASSIEKHGDLRCQGCGEIVRHKRGDKRRWHFAHLPDSTCSYGKDRDYDHEWHIRMQEYFPLETREILFVDAQTGERHIADVFLPEQNIVLEFQHSPISDKEFLSRTKFHLREGRRLVWLYDESEKNAKPDHFGRFKSSCLSSSFPAGLGPNAYCYAFSGNPYGERHYKWLRNPRSILSKLEPLENCADRLVICVYLGVDGEIFHRLQHKDHDDDEITVTFSLHDILMRVDMDAEEFFIPEEKWQQQPPWMDHFADFNRMRQWYENINTMERIKQLEYQRLNNQPTFRMNKPVRRKFRF